MQIDNTALRLALTSEVGGHRNTTYSAVVEVLFTALINKAHL